MFLDKIFMTFGRSSTVTSTAALAITGLFETYTMFWLFCLLSFCRKLITFYHAKITKCKSLPEFPIFCWFNSAPKSRSSPTHAHFCVLHKNSNQPRTNELKREWMSEIQQQQQWASESKTEIYMMKYLCRSPSPTTPSTCWLLGTCPTFYFNTLMLLVARMMLLAMMMMVVMVAVLLLLSENRCSMTTTTAIVVMMPLLSRWGVEAKRLPHFRL